MSKRTVFLKRYVEVEVEFDDESGIPLVPTKCSGCGMAVIRQKCGFDLQGDCPRFDQLAAYRVEMQKLQARQR